MTNRDRIRQKQDTMCFVLHYINIRLLCQNTTLFCALIVVIFDKVSIAQSAYIAHKQNTVTGYNVDFVLKQNWTYFVIVYTDRITCRSLWYG